MITNSCDKCIYKIIINNNSIDESIKKLPESPTNLNSIVLKNIINNIKRNKLNKEISYCSNEKNGHPNYITGEIEPVRCDILNHYGECLNFKSIEDIENEDTTTEDTEDTDTADKDTTENTDTTDSEISDTTEDKTTEETE